MNFLLNDAKNQLEECWLSKQSLVQIDQSDIKAMVRGELKLLKQLLKAAILNLKRVSKYHLEDIIVRIDNALDPK